MIILILTVLVSWGLVLWIGTLFSTLVPGIMEILSKET